MRERRVASGASGSSRRASNRDLRSKLELATKMRRSRRQGRSRTDRFSDLTSVHPSLVFRDGMDRCAPRIRLLQQSVMLLFERNTALLTQVSVSLMLGPDCTEPY